jgi:hypothetical protein
MGLKALIYVCVWVIAMMYAIRPVAWPVVIREYENTRVLLNYIHHENGQNWMHTFVLGALSTFSWVVPLAWLCIGVPILDYRYYLWVMYNSFAGYTWLYLISILSPLPDRFLLLLHDRFPQQVAYPYPRTSISEAKTLEEGRPEDASSQTTRDGESSSDVLLLPA